MVHEIRGSANKLFEDNSANFINSDSYSFVSDFDARRAGWHVRHAQIDAKGHPISVACIIIATIAPPGLSLINNTSHGNKIARIDINIRFIMNPPFIDLLIIDLS